jgi:uncharacterized protein
VLVFGQPPSNHSAIVSSMPALIAFRDGLGNPAFGVAITVAFIVIMDANSLRRQIGKHAKAINEIKNNDLSDETLLRERMGHTKIEIIAGIFVGVITAWGIDQF